MDVSTMAAISSATPEMKILTAAAAFLPGALAACGAYCSGQGSCADHVRWLQANRAMSCTDALALVKQECPNGECGDCAAPAACLPEYFLNFDTTPDSLGIGRGINVSTLGNYYYVVIGDWGEDDATGCGSMQQAVAERLRAYVSQRSARNPASQLLFVLSVGDNFYWTGLDDRGSQLQAWRRIYGPNLTAVPWFAVMGNHDWGNSDPTALCSAGAARSVCNNSTRATPACGGALPYVTDPSGITTYASNQLDAGKQGSTAPWRSDYPTFLMPDFAYFYQIPQLSLEILAVETSVVDAGGVGGNGCSGGASRLCAACGGADGVAAALKRMNAAAEQMLLRRARESANRNVAIINHYPGKLRGLRDAWLGAAGAAGADTVFTFAGHEHVQRCEASTAAGCVAFVTGGGGGCCTWDLCKANGPLGGFTVVGFREEGGVKQHVECFAAPDCSVGGRVRRAASCRPAAR